MEQAALKKMRTTQIAVSNLIAVILIIAFYMMIQIVEIRFTHFFLCLGILMLLQSIYGFMKKDQQSPSFQFTSR